MLDGRRQGLDSMRRLTVAAIVAVLVALAACGEDESPTSPSPITSPVTETFASFLSLRGTSSRNFVASGSGTIRVTLTSVGPPSVPIGLGLGVPGGTTPCVLSIALTTEADVVPQLAAPADPGTYCVQVYDVGNVVDSIAFSVTIEHP
jgi:hypothetical protein